MENQRRLTIFIPNLSAMAIANSGILAGVSGKLEDIVVKQYQGKTVITAVPDMSGRKLSLKQKESNERMLMATRTAKRITSIPYAKERACELLDVPPNKVFRAIIKHYMLTDGDGPLFGESEQEKRDSKTLTDLKTIIKADIPGAEIKLFGDRGKGNYSAKSDWDILILSPNDTPASLKWELQEKLFAVTMEQATRVNILLAQKSKWLTEPTYEPIRTRIESELLPVK